MLFGLALIAVAAFLLATSIMGAEADRGPGITAAGDYQGADTCQSCHATEYAEWNETNHARVFDPSAAFYQAFIARGAPNSCQTCHTIGYNKTAIGGYDPSLPWNSSYNLPRLGIQCENCHGPDTMSRPAGQQYNTSSDVCAQCHSGSRRPQYTEWQSSLHAQSPPAFVRNLACATCHEAKVAGDYLSTGQEPTALPANPRWQLTCSTCHDPHDATNEFQLRKPVQELCAACHTDEGAQPGDAVHHPQAEMRNGAGAVPVPGSQAMSAVYCVECHMYNYAYNGSLTPPATMGHSFEPKPEACVSCHDGTNGFRMTQEQAEKAIGGWQEATSLGLGVSQSAVENASNSIKAAPDYGFDRTSIDRARMYYDQANYSVNFVSSDGSMGAHNFDYASNLLSFANLKAGEVVTLLTPGTLSGTVVDADGNPVAGVQLTLGGKVWATSSSDGRFSFLHAPGSFTFTLVKDGGTVGAVDAVILAAQASDVRATAGAVSPQAAYNQTLQYASLLLLVIAVILILVMLLRRKPASAPSNEAPAEAEKPAGSK